MTPQEHIDSIELLDHGDESGPGGPPPPPRCNVCGKLLADCPGHRGEGGDEEI